MNGNQKERMTVASNYNILSYLWKPCSCLSYLLSCPSVFKSKMSIIQVENNTKLTTVTSFLPVARSSATLDLYKTIEGGGLCDGITQIVAMDFGE